MSKITNKILIPVVIALFLCVLLAVFLAGHFLENGAYVRIKEGNKLVEEVKLSEVKDSYEIELSHNTILVEKDGVTMKRATCPDKCCVDMGKITKANESIICLPSKVIVEIRGASSKLDAVSGGR